MATETMVPARSSQEIQYRALTEGAGLLDRSSSDRLEMRGEDRHRFLNAQVTCDVKDLAPGRLTYGFFTSRQGKIQADVTVLALEDRFWLELPAGRGEVLLEHLQKYLLADRVTIEPLVSVAPLTVLGEGALEALTSLGISGLPDEDGQHAEVELTGQLEGHTVRAVRQPLFTLPAVTYWVPAERLPTVAGWLLGQAPEGTGEWVAVEDDAVDVVRVERGVPRFGADFGPDCFPQETGLDHAVSYTKGCYLGQEVVARIHYRGGVNRHLRGLVFHGMGAAEDEVPVRGTELQVEGRAVGTVGTAVHSPALGGPAGLGILHKRAEPGMSVDVQGGGTAEVREVPLIR